MTTAELNLSESIDRPAWNLRWLTPGRCRWILAIVLLLDVLGHVNYLTYNCPIDLSGDEAQYWDWSRQLGLSYYSKGPLVAYIIRASTSIFGSTMPGVRYPAIAFGVGTSIIAYLLVKRLFDNEKLALGAVLLNHIVPMFVAGSVLMTIDPPFFFCWALATYFAAGAIFDKRSWNWPLCGLAVGFGFLAKFAAPLWFVGLIGFLLYQKTFRRFAVGASIAFIVSLALTTPVVIWNIQHHGASLWHVARQTGASGGRLLHGNFWEFIGSQIAVVGPVLAVLMVAAVIDTVRKRPDRADETTTRQDDALMYLLWIGVPFFVMTMLVSLFAKVQGNWPAPAYFTLMILTACYIGMLMQSRRRWKRWRPWFWGTVILGLITIPIAHDSSRLFPFVRAGNKIFGTKWNPARVDVLMRLRGWQLLGNHVSDDLAALGPGAFVICDDYMQTAETAFYTKGRPKTYYVGSYYIDAKRFTQYDMWPDRRLNNPALIGRNAVYIGKGGALPATISRAFDCVERQPEIPVIVNGVEVKSFKTWLAYGFKGLHRSGGPGDY